MKSSSLFMIFTAQKTHIIFSYDFTLHLNLGEMVDSECLAEFRVHKRDIPALANHVRIPENFYCQRRSVSDGIEGLCTLLRRLSYPCQTCCLVSLDQLSACLKVTKTVLN